MILAKKAVPVSFHNHYKKWLRYDLDYSHKYKQPYFDNQSLEKFIEKLREKKQSSDQQKGSCSGSIRLLRDAKGK